MMFAAVAVVSLASGSAFSQFRPPRRPSLVCRQSFNGRRSGGDDKNLGAPLLPSSEYFRVYPVALGRLVTRMVLP
jgi:hypothetical protein